MATRRGGGDAEVVRHLGERVRHLRVARRLSQEQLADLAHVHRTFIGRVERAETNATLTTIVKLAEALEVGADELLSGL